MCGTIRALKSAYAGRFIFEFHRNLLPGKEVYFLGLLHSIPYFFCVYVAGHFSVNYITTGEFTPVGPLLAPVVKHDFQMNWALLIISKRLILLKMLHLPSFSYPLTFSTLIPSYKSRHRQGWC
jgi:hypothetical protein